MKYHKTNMLQLLVLMAIVSSCIEEYTPEITNNNTKYVVHGLLTNKEGYHTITISESSELSSPRFAPVQGCTVEILDDKGNTFVSDSYDNGEYAIWIAQEYLNIGTKYKLRVQTPDNTIIESDSCEILPSPSFDSLYYIREEPEMINPEFLSTLGIRFYVDFSGEEKDSKFLRWEITETWEYHTYEILYVYIDRRGRHWVDINDKSKSICWKTETLRNSYPLTTNQLDNNIYRKVPLHYVDNHTQRLLYGYHLVINQYAISKEAYWFWKQVEENSIQDGGLYEKQPLPIKGNIRNISNPDQVVLGFFEVATENTKILFIKDFVMKMNIPECYLQIPDPKKPFPPFSLAPIYITFVNGQMFWMAEHCWNCLAREGTNVKPNFWPAK